MTNSKSRVDCHEFDDFTVQEIALVDVSIQKNTISFTYVIEDDEIRCQIRYSSVDFTDPAIISTNEIKRFGVILAVICSLRFGAILPKKLNFEKYSHYIDLKLLKFVEAISRGHWSQHRYQLGKLDYNLPEFILDSSKVGQEVVYPIWSIANVENSVDILLGSGSGKDSLLCSLILERAGIDYDIVTYFHDIYGNDQVQEEVFNQVKGRLKNKGNHQVFFYDEYYPWLEKRLSQTNVIARAKDYFVNNRFRTEAGETLLTTLAIIPVQIVKGIPLLVLGHEKSADAPNLIEPESGEEIAHQFTKSFFFHQLLTELIARMFEGVNVVSLTKPINDVKIFELLFRLDNTLPYFTNSCNLQKPWCCRCEKCCYVFAGFCAYGDVDKTIDAFGNNLFDMEENLPIWEELLGLKGYIAWECVGLPMETQYYFYKLYQNGVKGKAITIFEQQILNPLREKGEEAVEQYFSEINRKCTDIYDNHHTMPDWLWNKVRPVLTTGNESL